MFKLGFLLYLPIIFFFLPAFAIYIPGTQGGWLVYYFSLYMCLLLLLIKYKARLVAQILDIIKSTPMKYLFFAFLVIIINAFILSILNISSMPRIIYNTILLLFLQVIPIVLFFIYIINKISVEKFVKLFTVLLWLDLLIGFIAYIGDSLNIQGIINVFNFFANSRILSLAHKGYDTVFQASGYSYHNIPRLDNLFEEASGYAMFLYIFLPLIYHIAGSDIVILKNHNLNAIIKNTLVPFTWISIILTLSPIYLLFSLLITLIVYFNKIIYFIKKHYLAVLLLTVLFVTTICIVTLKINLSNTYLYRIINVITSLKSFDNLVLIEASLATRIVNYVNTFIVFLHHPVLGVGAGNIPTYLYKQYLYSPLTLTYENMQKFTLATYGGKLSFNRGFIYAWLAEFGIIVTGLFLYSYIKTFVILNKCKKRCFDQNRKAILNAISGCMISCFLIFIYNLNSNDVYLPWVLAIVAIYHEQYLQNCFIEVQQKELINEKD